MIEAAILALVGGATGCASGEIAIPYAAIAAGLGSPAVIGVVAGAQAVRAARLVPTEAARRLKE